MIPRAESTPPISPDEREIDSLDTSIEAQYDRNKSIRIDKLLDMGIIKIRPGMTILDIGTGGGYYAYKFAEKLKGTGRVFATDIKIESINYVAEEARKRGLRNLYPVLVNEEGVDGFYSKQKYDLIFLSSVHPENLVNYFKEMRNFLAEDGRLVIVDYKTSHFSFFKEDFIDFKGLIKDLSREPANSPFYTGLRESTRKLIKQKPKGASHELLKDAIIADFNRMLVNPLFFASFLNGRIFKNEIPFTPAERDFANRILQLWQSLNLRAERGFDTTQKDYLCVRKARAIMRLNKLFLIQRFRKYLYEGEGAPYISRAVVGKNIKPDERERCFERWLATIREELEETGYNLKDKGGLVSLENSGLVSLENTILVLRRVLEDAGYKLENEYEFVPFRIILVFKAKKDALK